MPLSAQDIPPALTPNTERLCERFIDACAVVAIERDPRCVEALGELVAAYPDRLRVIAGDALDVDPAPLSSAPRAIVANLPYNIATPLLFKWLRRLDRFADFTLMFQKEVGARLTARPRSKAYGRLSVAAQWRCQARALLDVPARALTPPPKVTSTLVGLGLQIATLLLAAFNPSWSQVRVGWKLERLVVALDGCPLGESRDGLEALIAALSARQPEALRVCFAARMPPEQRARVHELLWQRTDSAVPVREVQT